MRYLILLHSRGMSTSKLEQDKSKGYQYLRRAAIELTKDCEVTDRNRFFTPELEGYNSAYIVRQI